MKMEWNLLLRKDRYALLQSKSDSQYVVASGYNPKGSSGATEVIFHTGAMQTRKLKCFRMQWITSGA